MITRNFLLLIIAIAGCTVLKKNATKGNPPGTLKINDTLFIDQTEVGNIHWREYLYYLSDVKKDELEYEKRLPDTSAWQLETDTVHDPLSEYYFRHPSFNNYPVVGVSYEQVIEFCKWRTYIVNLGMYIHENKLTNFKEHLKDPFPIKIYYRLPTKEEWEMIAGGKLSPQQYPFGYDTIYKEWRDRYQKIFNCIYSDKSVKDSIQKEEYYTVELKSYYPNSFGCYNMIGNVAEMVSEKGVAKGGSYTHLLDSCRISTDQHYNKPERWLGFRCVAVKIN